MKSSRDNIKKLLQYFAIFLVAFICCLYGYLKSTHGFSLTHTMTDEGYHITAAHRLAMGDKALVNDHKASATQFASIARIIYEIFPGINWLQIRFLSQLAHMLSFIPLAIVLSYYSPLLLVVFISGAVCYPTTHMPTFSYDTLAGNFSVFSLGLWLLGMQVSRWGLRFVLSFAAGICLALSNIANLSLITLLLVPVVFAVVLLARKGINAKTDPVFQTALTILFVSILCSIVLRAWFLPLSVWLAESSSAVGAISTGNGSGGGLLRNFTDEIRHIFWLWRPFVSWALVFALIYAIAKMIRNKPGIYWIVFSFISGAVIFGLLTYPFDFRNRNWSEAHYHFLCLAYVVVFYLFAVFLFEVKKRRIIWDKGWHTVAFLGAGWGVIHMATQSISSTVSLVKGIFGVAPVIMIGGVLLYRYLANSSKYRMLPAYAVVFALFAGGLYTHWGHVPGGGSLAELDASFKHPKLKGISAPGHVVEDLDSLLEFLRHKLNPGDFLLNYYHIPGLNFLTDTRPSINSTWIWPAFPLGLRQQMVNEMIESGRTPDYAVRAYLSPLYPSSSSEKGVLPEVFRAQYFNPFPWLQPINAFMERNYRKIKTIGPYEVWRRKQAEIETSKNFTEIRLSRDDEFPFIMLRKQGDFVIRKSGGSFLIVPQDKGLNHAFMMGCRVPLKQIRGKRIYFSLNAVKSKQAKARIHILETGKNNRQKISSADINSYSYQRSFYTSQGISMEPERVLFLMEFSAENQKQWLRVGMPRGFVTQG